MFYRWGLHRVCHVRLCVQDVGAAAAVAVVSVGVAACCVWVLGCVVVAATWSPHCLLVFCRWGRRRVYHARLRVQVAGAAAVVTAVCPWVSPPAVCLAAWLLLRLGRVDLAPLSSVLAAGAVEHCGSADASAAGSLACGVEEDAVLTSLWRRQRGLQSVAAVVPVLDGVGGCCVGCGGGWCGGGCGASPCSVWCHQLRLLLLGVLVGVRRPSRCR